MTNPNAALRAIRMGMRLSQDDLARALRDAGAVDANKRLVQRWEAGITSYPRPMYARALEVVTGLPVASLGFRAPIPGGEPPETAPGEMPTSAPMAAGRANYSGIWLSTYEYPSSSRGSVFTGRHHVLVLQNADRLTVRSLPNGADGDLSMDLAVDGAVVSGNWSETTSATGYYRGARYFGTVQMIADPTGRRMAGKWLGFGRDLEINTGPWDLTFLDASTAKAAVERFDVRPEA